MKIDLMGKLLFLLAWITLLQGCGMVKSLTYDYSSSVECLAEPPEPQYGGGVVRNADFSAGLQGWSAFGYGSLAEGTSPAGNRYAMATNRTRPYQSVSQKVLLQNDTHYTLSAWLQVSGGVADVRVVVKTTDDFVHAGGVVAKSGCWSMLKGGLTTVAGGRAEIYFESNATADVWVDSVSLKPFTREEWSTHRDVSAGTARRKTVRLQATDSAGNPLPGAAVSLETVRNGFPLGAAMSSEILRNPTYQSWFASRFTVATFENEMKWYSTEPAPGREDYSVPDAMLEFARQHGIAVRGHNVFWDDPNQQPRWVQALPYPQLLAAASRRIRSVVARYAGKLIAWDVVNENLHYSFFERRFGWDASTAFYAAARMLDGGSTLMFMNEYNTLEQPGDMAALPARYMQRLKQITSGYPQNGAGMAIGLEGHFTAPVNIPYMRAALDTLAQAGIPVWLTEVDVAGSPSQAYYLEEVLREAYAHPAVQGVILWAAWRPQGCYVMCLTDNEFNNLPQGDVVDRLITEWSTAPRTGTTDAEGFFQADLAHGEYKVTVTHPSLNTSVSQSVKVELGSGSHYFIHV
ncbi:endo-1,4-beta-xylanase 5-like [Oryza brachyantha]|uniref:GH10 domain-containing protein n=1 Tax=Oryza brachyantha TaxID=4533 RepID=J3LL35_ORYBR|nr:endo-1,4-beta-xylanase 5-like [Oryza brachyantha]